jgi:hypothetical protein
MLLTSTNMQIDGFGKTSCWACCKLQQSLASLILKTIIPCLFHMKNKKESISKVNGL